MKLKLLTIFLSSQALHALGENTLINTFEIMQLRLEIRKIKPILEEIEKFRNDLVKKYGTFDEKTRQLSVAPGTEAYNHFAEEFNKFLENDQELDLKRITISYKKDEKLGISGNQANLVDYFIDFKVKE